MRILISFKPRQKCSIPINYQYPLSQSLFTAFNTANARLAYQLHNSMKVKPYSFSYLKLKNYKIIKDSIYLSENSKASLIFTSGIKGVVTMLTQGLLMLKTINLSGNDFDLLNIKEFPEIDFKKVEKFRCLSPFVLVEKVKNEKYNQFLLHDSENLSEMVRQNLIYKCEMFHGFKPENEEFDFKLDNEYVQTHSKKLYKLITIKENEEDETQIKAIYVPFHLSGSVIFREIAYNYGIGSKTALGFGCIGCY